MNASLRDDEIDLDTEWSACVHEFTGADLTLLGKMIGRRPAVNAIMVIGAADIAVRDGRWRRQFRGERALVVADLDWYWWENPYLKDMPGGGVEGGTNGIWKYAVRDLIAFRPETPRSYWPMAGRSWMFGFDSIEEANCLEKPLRVHECPLDWLKADRDGLVVIDWLHDWSLFFHNIPALQFDDRQFAERAMERFRRPAQIPQALVPAA